MLVDYLKAIKSIFYSKKNMEEKSAVMVILLIMKMKAWKKHGISMAYITVLKI